jgi:glycosyltransferase involved in cell wall biosynthesis
MKHIVIVGKYYPPEFGGVERYTHEVARIAAKNHRVTVVVHNTRGNDTVERYDNIEVIRCGTAKVIKAQPISPSMFRHLRSLKPDLVQFNAPNFWGAAMLSLVSYKAPLIVTHHADVFGRPLLKKLGIPVYRHLVRRAKVILVNSLRNAATSADLPRGAGPLVAIPHGVDATCYQIDDAERLRLMAERYRQFGDAPLVGFVGRLVRYKGLPVLVDAIARLPKAHALIIGEGPLKEQVEEQARVVGVAGRVHFLGGIDEPAKIRRLAIMDALLLPSTDATEAFGVAQIEAQLMRIPVIASHLPTGITDITKNNETGLLVEPGDPDALAAAIARVIDNRDLAVRLGLAGRAHALRHFTLDAFETSFTELLEFLLANKRIEGPVKEHALDATSSHPGRRNSDLRFREERPLVS